MATIGRFQRSERPVPAKAHNEPHVDPFYSPYWFLVVGGTHHKPDKSRPDTSL